MVKILCTILYLYKKFLKFEIQKCGQILCAHKIHFLMLGHIYVCIYVSIVMHIQLLQAVQGHTIYDV